jgi:hypothetical protein
MKIDLHTIEKPDNFFIIEKNNLNNMYMVFSEYRQLPYIWFFKSKKQAMAVCNKLNLQANNEYQSFFNRS